MMTRPILELLAIILISLADLLLRAQVYLSVRAENRAADLLDRLEPSLEDYVQGDRPDKLHRKFVDTLTKADKAEENYTVADSYRQHTRAILSPFE